MSLSLNRKTITAFPDEAPARAYMYSTFTLFSLNGSRIRARDPGVSSISTATTSSTRAGSCLSMMTLRAFATSDTRIRRTPKSALSLMQRDRRLIPASPSAWVASYSRPGAFSRKIDNCFNFIATSRVSCVPP